MKNTMWNNQSRVQLPYGTNGDASHVSISQPRHAHNTLSCTDRMPRLASISYHEYQFVWKIYTGTLITVTLLPNAVD